MPTVTNPTPYTIPCHPLGRLLASEETVRVSREVASQISTVVFVVSDADPEPEADAAVEVKPRKATPTRKTAKRGGQKAEVTEAPEVETR